MTNKASTLARGTIAVYRAAAWAGHRVVSGAADRRAALSRWQAWSAQRSARPLWVHAASVGEALTALPVIKRVRILRPDVPVMLTHTSSSLVGWPCGGAVDRCDFLPLDEPGSVRTMLNALAPRLIVFSRSDIWPELIGAAARRDIPVSVIGGTVGHGSRRLHWPMRALFRDLYGALAYVAAASSTDAKRLIQLGVSPQALEVTGDPRHDYVLERPVSGASLQALAHWAAAGPVLVAGSTDTRDETVLLRAAAAVLGAHPGARLLVCPHDARPSGIAGLLALARRTGLSAGAWNGEQVAENAAPCLIVQPRGILADLYALAAVAYVGGGLAGRLHSVIEPAAFSIPTVFGPLGHSQDAVELLSAGAAATVSRRHAEQQLAHRWGAWLQDETARTGAGLAARRTVKAGAASITALRLTTLLERH